MGLPRNLRARRSKPKNGLPLFLAVAGSVKMIRFSYSNKDTKDEEEKRGLAGVRQPLSRCYAQPR